ncbi:MAG: hypothetical protein U9M97_04980 [Candidatus Hadarchaeota archaeon]|nr:hypothetical protein [Candidatus Hadarchaeota archaeon]
MRNQSPQTKNRHDGSPLLGGIIKQVDASKPTGRAEVSEVFRAELTDARHELVTQIDRLSRELELVKNELEKLGERVIKLQSMIVRAHTRRS